VLFSRRGARRPLFAAALGAATLCRHVFSGESGPAGGCYWSGLSEREHLRGRSAQSLFRNPSPQLLRPSLSAQSRQHPQLAHNQHIDVHRLLVPHQVNVPVVPVRSRPVPFYLHDHVFFML